MLRERLGHLFVGGQNDVPFAFMKATKDMIPLENKIIECRFEAGSGPNGGKWVFMRQRTDKSFPNSYNTATGNKNLQNISSIFCSSLAFFVFSGLSKYPRARDQPDISGLYS